MAPCKNWNKNCTNINKIYFIPNALDSGFSELSFFIIWSIMPKIHEKVFKNYKKVVLPSKWRHDRWYNVKCEAIIEQDMTTTWTQTAGSEIPWH
jgi:hypothetical protein